MTTQCFVGFDPGGKNAFGWAVLEERDGALGPLRSGTCSDAVTQDCCAPLIRVSLQRVKN